jgi:hypothetical protein
MQRPCELDYLGDIFWSLVGYLFSSVAVAAGFVAYQAQN